MDDGYSTVAAELQEFKYSAAYALFTDLSERNKLKESVWRFKSEEIRLAGQVAELAKQLSAAETERQNVLADLETLTALRARMLGKLPLGHSRAIELILSMDIFYRSDGWQSCPQAEGVYVLYKGLELIYIGESENIRQRLRQHVHREFTQARYKEVLGGKAARREVEDYLTSVCKPPQNSRWRRMP